jgi:hypothetical protein
VGSAGELFAIALQHLASYLHTQGLCNGDGSSRTDGLDGVSMMWPECVDQCVPPVSSRSPSKSHMIALGACMPFRSQLMLMYMCIVQQQGLANRFAKQKQYSDHSCRLVQIVDYHPLRICFINNSAAASGACGLLFHEHTLTPTCLSGSRSQSSHTCRGIEACSAF